MLTNGLAEKYRRRAALCKKGSVSVEQLRDEGVFEIGRVDGTSVLFAVTEDGVRLFHAEQVKAVMS